MAEISSLIELIRETAAAVGSGEWGTTTDASTTALTIASYPAQTNRTNASNKVYEGNEVYLEDAQASSTIASADLSATATTFTVASGASFAASAARPYVVGVDSEFMLVTLSSATFTILQRGFYGTRAAVHAIGATVYGPGRTPNPNGIGAYVASTGVLTPSVTYNADPGTTVPYDILFDGVGYWDVVVAVNKALRQLHYRSTWPLSLLQDGDMQLSGISNWAAGGSATVAKVATSVQAYTVLGHARSLRITDTGGGGGYAQSGTLFVDPANAGSWFVHALTGNRLNAATATLRPYDVTNSANIAVSGTQTWVQQGFGHVNLWFTLPATCQYLAFRLESTTASDVTDWLYVLPYPIGATSLPLPTWFTRRTQLVYAERDRNWSALRADTPDLWPIPGATVEEDLANPNNQARLVLPHAIDGPIWLDAYRPYDLLTGDAQTAFVDRELVTWVAAAHLARDMAAKTSGAAKTGWENTYKVARAEGRRVSLERSSAAEVVLG